MVRTPAQRLLIGLAVSAATFLLASSSAQAGWAPPSSSSHLTCAKDWRYVDGGRGRECAVVTPGKTGAWVQSMVQVINDTSVYRQAIGWTVTVVAGHEVSDTSCGYTWLAPNGGQMWCWGQTTPVSGHGKYVYGRGDFCIFTSASNICGLKIYSPLAYT